MEKTKALEVFPRLTVYLPPDIEKAVYADFKNLVEHAISETTRSITVNTRYLNQKELCDYFSCGIEVIRGWRTEGLKSFTKGKEIMFDMKDVSAFLDTKKY